MRKLFETQKILIEQFEKRPFYQREQFSEIIKNKNMTGIIGPRGVGKTTFLLWYAIQRGAKEEKVLYISADHLFFLENQLIDLVDKLYKQTRVEMILIDEIHKAPHWRAVLKNISDTYPSIRVFFSGSSTIDLMQGKYDLSRRVTLHLLTGFSFREYLEFKEQQKFSRISFEDLLDQSLEFNHELKVSKILMHFKEYLKCGYYPFFEGFTEELEKFQSLENAVQMTIYEDISNLHSLKTTSLRTIEQLYKFVISSSPGEISSFKLSKTLRKDYESISSYLNYLQQAGLIRFIYSAKPGKGQLKGPIKMYPDNTNLIYCSVVPLLEDQEKGKIRDTFVINQLQNAQLSPFYSDEGDFQIKDVNLEVGGKSKTKKQIKNKKKGFVFADDIIVGTQEIIPLYLLGFLS